jgi:hypothetical protein
VDSGLVESPVDDAHVLPLAGCVGRLLRPARASRWSTLLVSRKLDKLDPFELLAADRRDAAVEFVAFGNSMRMRDWAEAILAEPLAGLAWKGRGAVIGLRGDVRALCVAATARRGDRWVVCPRMRISFVTTHEGDFAALAWSD